MEQHKTNRILPLIGFIALIAVVQIIGASATFTSVGNWYQELEKVAWNPPDWVFGPVWTALYLMIAISGWRVWVKLQENQLEEPAMHWYFFQLIVNLCWSIFFFGFRDPFAGMVDILVLIVGIVITIKKFLPIDKVAAYMLIPYLLWVCYAATLNAGILYLN